MDYYITYDKYFGYCVIEAHKGSEKIIFAGSIEDCNNKCVEMNEKKEGMQS